MIDYPELFTGESVPVADLLAATHFKTLPATRSRRAFPVEFSGASCQFPVLANLAELESIAKEL